jgi:hypothetical protein
MRATKRETEICYQKPAELIYEYKLKPHGMVSNNDNKHNEQHTNNNTKHRITWHY